MLQSIFTGVLVTTYALLLLSCAGKPVKYKISECLSIIGICSGAILLLFVAAVITPHYHHDGELIQGVVGLIYDYDNGVTATLATYNGLYMQKKAVIGQEMYQWLSENSLNGCGAEELLQRWHRFQSLFFTIDAILLSLAIAVYLVIVLWTKKTQYKLSVYFVGMGLLILFLVTMLNKDVVEFHHFSLPAAFSLIIASFIASSLKLMGAKYLMLIVTFLLSCTSAYSLIIVF
jgi:uncharacterized integral membrane protein